MLSALPPLRETEDPLNFLYPIEESLVLRDSGLIFPEDLANFEPIPPLEREVFMPTLIRALLAARGKIVMSGFFCRTNRTWRYDNRKPRQLNHDS